MTDIDQNGLEAAVRECARITAPEVTDEEFERERVEGSSRYLKTREEMSRAIRAYLSAQQREPVVRVKELEWQNCIPRAWSVAARLAGWPDDRPLWTGSCPCQPFSPAGAGESSDAVAQGDCSTVFLGETAQGLTASEAHDGGSPGPSPLAVATLTSDPASGRSQPSPDVSVDELAEFIRSLDILSFSAEWHDEEYDAARALLARFRIERLDRLASSGRSAS